MSRVASLRKLLSVYFPADRQEREHLQAILSLLERGPRCLARDHFEPGHVTASAFVLAPDGQRVLLIHHIKLQRWLQPGGHVEVDDTDVFAAARREVAEECGLTALEPLVEGVFDVDVHTIPARRSEPAHRHFDVRVALRATAEGVQVGDGVSAVAWVPLHEVTAATSDESVARAVRKLAALR